MESLIGSEQFLGIDTIDRIGLGATDSGLGGWKITAIWTTRTDTTPGLSAERATANYDWYIKNSAKDVKLRKVTIYNDLGQSTKTWTNPLPVPSTPTAQPPGAPPAQPPAQPYIPPEAPKQEPSTYLKTEESAPTESPLDNVMVQLGIVAGLAAAGVGTVWYVLKGRK